ncbi:hypothetical protein TNCV_643441, partial [Trichonephila clavipes]
MPIQRDKPPILVRKQRICPLNETSHQSGCDKKEDDN